MQILVENQLLALLVIMGVGLALGQIRIFGFKLGVAAVLFVGLGLATFEPDIQIPPLIYIVGLALFVYTIGLESGPEFFASLRSRGIRHNIFGFAILAVLAVEALVLVKVFPLGPEEGVGTFTGALTNTPALAAVVDSLPSLISDDPDLQSKLEMPVIGYSLAYPIGVIGVIASIAIMAKVFRVDHDREALEAGVAALPLHTRRVQVTETDLPSVTDMPVAFGLDFTVSRIEHKGRLFVAAEGDTVEVGDVVSIVGTEDLVDAAAAKIGDLVPGDPTKDGRLDFRRIFVSSERVCGVPLSELHAKMNGMIITRVRRGDLDMVASPSMKLELGDRVRVVAPPDRIDNATRFFGDSYKKLSDVNLLPMVLGLLMGVLVGMIPVPLPGGVSITLGSAGGPLVVALVLGALGRTGPLVWPIPYSANLAFRQVGLALFLAGIGTTAGAGFKEALSDPTSLTVLGMAAILAFSSAFLTLIIGHKFLKIPFGQTAGILAGLQTHPAVLQYVNDQSKNELPAMGYSTVYPMAMIVKIVAAQLLIVALV
ncbi:aspartate:alanine exchanger family transporter [uncultured Corynebacterium sp.]|uniref:aspartate:alanine exchanger family transporter n=1 Tax=uncultured Corynebacterium sp. TaxID=159447 RepID=UPI0025D51770|nr:aspartate:alanine exchanger family transporter [uncultured Corynebacterium sp.]